MGYVFESEEAAGVAVVRAVSEYSDCAVESLPPVQTWIDVDALTEIFDRTTDANPQVTFEYTDLTVSVEHERITVSPTESGETRGRR